eukprot:g1075.t1
MKSNTLRASSRSTVAEVIGKRISEKTLVPDKPQEDEEDDGGVLYHMGLAAKAGNQRAPNHAKSILVDLCAETVMQMGELVKKGVDVYLLRSMPVIFTVVMVVAAVVWLTAGGPFVISMLIGASTCMFCANLGTNMNFEGGPRLTHAMNYDLPGSLQSGVRTGAIGGLSAHSLAQVGVVLVWMIVGDANALVGFGAGTWASTYLTAQHRAASQFSQIHKVPYFGTSLPFALISTGTLGCTAVCYKVRCFEKDTARRIRRSLQCNLFAVILLVQAAAVGYCYLHWRIYHTISFDELIGYNDAHLGPMQVILQGLGQGFVSAGIPSVVNIIVQIVAFRLEGFYGLMLLACASQSCTGWQATLAAYGAVANNALRMSHLTTVNELAHHRQNAFFATTALLGALLADKRTKQGVDFTSTVGQELSELFLANTVTSCIRMAKKLVHFCKEKPEQSGPRLNKTFPATHIIPLKTLTGFAAIESFQLTFSPMCQTFAAPLDAARKYVLFGMLEDKDGNDIYDEFPDKTWLWGIAQVFLNFGLVGFFKFGLAEAVRQLESFLRRRREAVELEEGVAMLKEIEKREKERAQRLEGRR